MKEAAKIIVWVFADKHEFPGLESAMRFAIDADSRYANGFVQVFDSDGRRVFGRPQ